MPALNIVRDNALLDFTIEQTKIFAKKKINFVIFGTGGSSLGARALINICIDQPKNIIFFDNIDPLFFEKIITNLDIQTTGFIIISKSGSTPETLSQFGSIINLAKEKNILESLYANTLVLTEFKNSPLYNIAKKNNCLLLEHKKDIGGRYSVFSNVGMVPSIIAGLDVKKIHLPDYKKTYKFYNFYN